MPFPIRPFRRFLEHYAVTYNAGPFQAKAPSGAAALMIGQHCTWRP